jgi:hypothetical protein
MLCGTTHIWVARHQRVNSSSHCLCGDSVTVMLLVTVNCDCAHLSLTVACLGDVFCVPFHIMHDDPLLHACMLLMLLKIQLCRNVVQCCVVLCSVV